MGSVTATVTDSVNDVFQTRSIHFESYEDFINYENSATIQPESRHTAAENKNNICLTDDQIYKIRILLGHVLGDKDCDNLNEQLDCLYDNELECEDYDKLFFTFMQGDERVVLEDGDKEATIQFK